MTPARAAPPLPPMAAAEDSAFARLWFGFATSRVVVGLVLTGLLAGVRALNPASGVSNWVLGMCGAYFLAALAARLLLRPVRFDHKTVFSVLAWLVFAWLLLGRARFGWRGRKAVRVLYTGSILLLLAYAGSRFVMEVILRRAS